MSRFGTPLDLHLPRRLHFRSDNFSPLADYQPQQFNLNFARSFRFRRERRRSRCESSSAQGEDGPCVRQSERTTRRGSSASVHRPASKKSSLLDWEGIIRLAHLSQNRVILKGQHDAATIATDTRKLLAVTHRQCSPSYLRPRSCKQRLQHTMRENAAFSRQRRFQKATWEKQNKKETGHLRVTFRVWGTFARPLTLSPTKKADSIYVNSHEYLQHVASTNSYPQSHKADVEKTARSCCAL